MHIRLSNLRLWTLAVITATCCTTIFPYTELFAKDIPASAEYLRGTKLLPIDSAAQVRIKTWLRKEFPDNQIRRITWRQPLLREFHEEQRQMAEKGKQQAKTWVEEQKQKDKEIQNDLAEYRVRMNALQPAEKKLRMRLRQLIELNEGLMKIHEQLLEARNQLLTSNRERCEWLDELRDAPQILHRISVIWDVKEKTPAPEFLISITPEKIVRLSESRRKSANSLWLQPVEPRFVTRDLVIQRLQKQHKTGNDWDALADLANTNIMVHALKLKDAITPQIAREAVEGTPKERGTVTIEEVVSSKQEPPR